MEAEDHIRALLLTLDPAILLLNLAGYQVPEVVGGIPKSAQETAPGDLVSIEVRTMQIRRGTTLQWVDPDPALASAHVALWIEPRFPAARPGTGVTLDLGGLAFALASDGISAGFDADGTGWLDCSWQAGDESVPWNERLALQVTALTEELRAELADHREAALAAGDAEPAVTGLLSMYDPTTWRVALSEEELPAGVEEFGGRIRALTLDGDEATLVEFLDEEAPTVPGSGPVAAAPTVVERLRVPEGDDLVEELSACVDELANLALDGATTDAQAAFEFASGSYADLNALSVTQLLMRWQELGLVDFLASIAPADDFYGGYDLQIGDLDAGTGAGAPRYGGRSRSAEAGDPLPADGEPGFVAQLRRDIAELGFGPAFRFAQAEAGEQAFDVELELAVRELQLSAKLPKLAAQIRVGAWQFWGDGLDQVDNAGPYRGPVSGTVNADTRALIQVWRESHLRCPIVLEARALDKKGRYTLPYYPGNGDNLWRADQLTDATPRVFARDFSGAYPLEPDSVARGRTSDGFVLGAWTGSKFGSGPWAKPPAHVWAEREVLPELLAGAPFDHLTAASRSTFRVVRAVAEVECIGFFDSFNAYDRGVTSLGPCHWTIALEKNDKLDEAPELPALFAYLRWLGGAAGDAFERVVGGAGCGVDREWTAPTCWDATQRKYVARITLEREAGAPLVLAGAEVARAEWFRQWHWCFRFSMAARTIPEYRRRMWDFARLRLRDLLATPWVPRIMTADPATADPATGMRPATVGDLFTSERAAGILLRWHVNAPSDLLPIRVASKLTTAFANAGAAAWGDPVDWGDTEEAALTQALNNLHPQSLDNWLRNSLDHVYNWATATSWDVLNSKTKQVEHTTWEAARAANDWTLTAAQVSGAPTIVGLANARTDVGVKSVHQFAVTWRDVIGDSRQPTVVSSDQTVVRDVDLVVSPAGPDWTLTARPVAGKSGTSRITVTADNGAHVATTQWTLRVGPAGKNPDPAPTSAATEGLSVRRNSLQLDWEDLP